MPEDEFGEKEFGSDDARMSIEELCEKYQTDARHGLKKKMAEALLRKEGKNVMGPEIESRHFVRCLRDFVSFGAGLLLWVVAGLCLISSSLQIVRQDEPILTTLIPCLVLSLSALSVGLISFLQVKRIPDSHLGDRFADKETEVIRDGEKMKIPTEDLVVGDLVFLKNGDRVPADVRIIEGENLIVDNFPLTGIHDPRHIHERTEEADPLESPNVAFYSCVVIEGAARGIVIRKGRRTLIATIFALREKDGKLMSPITVQIIHFLNVSASWVTALGAILALIFWFSAEDRRATIDIFVLVSLGCLTENFLFATFLSVRLYSRKMWECCTVGSAGAMERLPFVSAICFNKPGSVTQNRVVVSNLWFDDRTVEVWGGTKIVWREKTSATFKELAKCAILGNEAEFEREEENMHILKRKITGNPNDAAIFKFFCYTMGNRVNKLREAYPRVFWIRYGVNRKFQLSVHRMGKNFLLILVGEPETLLKMCSTYLKAGESVPIDATFLRSIDKACVKFAKFGETMKCIIDQVVAPEGGKDEGSFAQNELPTTGYRFLGIITLFDPPSMNIVRAVKKCRKAGIKVFLTTDDHPITARSFARQIGIISEDSYTVEDAAEGIAQGETQFKAVVIDGNDLGILSVKNIENLMETSSEVVFARVSPLQKLFIIASCQKNDSIVAFVGDGINDLFAMAKANLGVAFHTNNRDAADVVVPDGDFNALVTCLEEGRTMYENLKKSTAFALATNAAFLIPTAAYCLVGLPLPLSPIGVVLIKYFTDVILAVALVFEKKESNLMRQPPHSPSGTTFWSNRMIFYSCLQIGVLESFAGFFTYFIIMEEYGWSPPSLIGIRDRWESVVVNDLEDSRGQRWSYDSRKNLQSLCQTGYFFTQAIMQCANALICRSRKNSLLRTSFRNWTMNLVILFKISIVISAIYIPYLTDLDQMRALKVKWWLLPLPYVALLLVQDEARKYLIRRHPNGWLQREIAY